MSPITLRLPIAMALARPAKAAPVVLPQLGLTREIIVILLMSALTNFGVGPEPAV